MNLTTSYSVHRGCVTTAGLALLADQLGMYYCLLTFDERSVREEIESQDITSAVANAYQLFNERPELRVVELWQDQLILKLERHST